ncbi:MAG: hypothetical protein IPP02_03395 [Chitinophagaceae bacterium]|jgi:hypothetical protein|nr:hypothetical protein [Chitinophagaceae bacterium]MBK7678873.1 hypothetical protein [Chitinophagaceae bacterium]MBK8299781.1 hypothetical protein [Chitinophagaceae bacterium]MBK9463831.1 hypothetical protein [Chitinophagaceae bacterium]MBK9659054.1 hypothetical protein [Chitinophagaceae bacterium]
MRRVFIFLLFISSSFCHAQSDSTTRKGQDIKKLVFDDSSLQRLQKLKDSVANAIQTRENNQVQENMSRNMDGILQLQKERNAKQKKAAIIRIGIGVAFLIVLIIGLRRRKK